MNEAERLEMLDDEWLIIRNSGEIPEITYHSSLYFLTDDPVGPGLLLVKEEIRVLQSAAVERYEEIILRDLLLENYHKTIYRGIRRSIYNLERYQQFCTRQGMEWQGFQETVAQQLLLFLGQGRLAAGKELPLLFLNCTFAQLLSFSDECGVARERLPDDAAHYCVLAEK